MIDSRIEIPLPQIARFCRRWHIAEMSVFGSALREDFRDDSDIDLLVSFAPSAEWSLYDWIQMKDELEAIFSRRVDLLSKAGLRNPFRRNAILNHRQVIYAD